MEFKTDGTFWNPRIFFQTQGIFKTDGIKELFAKEPFWEQKNSEFDVTNTWQ